MICFPSRKQGYFVELWPCVLAQPVHERSELEGVLDEKESDMRVDSKVTNLIFECKNIHLDVKHGRDQTFSFSSVPTLTKRYRRTCLLGFNALRHCPP